MSLQPILSENELTQSFNLLFSITNDATPPFEYVNSSQPEFFDNFVLTVDQLEGEINVPYQFVNQIEDGEVIRRIDVPNSILGGFTQFRVNYIFTQFPEEAPGNEGVYLVGENNTERIFAPAFIPPVGTEEDTFELVIDENYIREAFADEIYNTFFNNLDLPPGVDVDYNSLQSTIREGHVVTGRQEGEQLVFFKKDRNTPENRKDFNEGLIGEIITDISSSVALTPNPQDFNISEFLTDKFTIVIDNPDTSDTVSDPSVYNLPPVNPPTQLPYILKKIFYTLRYIHDTVTISIPFGEIHYVVSVSDENDWLWHEFANVINVSQVTVPTLGSNKINPARAKEVLDTNIFELLPNQKSRQDDIDKFFQDFNNLAGPTPPFNDIDNDNISEQLLDNQNELRISTAPNNRNAFITRTNAEANERNVNKTLESMRNTLNRYLTDVDNIVEEIQDDRPEYENKSTGFLKIRQPNQAIILRNPDGGELEFQKNNRFLTGGFTITMWVRFTSRTGRGTLFNFGNPYRRDIENRYGLRLETLTKEVGSEDTPSYRRIVRLVVADHLATDINEGIPRLYDSNVGGPSFERYDTNSTPLSPKLAYREPDESTDIGYQDSLNAFLSYTEIPTDDLNEWFFICATYNPNIDEFGSHENINQDETNRGWLLTDTQYWLNHRLYIPYQSGGSEYRNWALATMNSSTEFVSLPMDNQILRQEEIDNLTATASDVNPVTVLIYDESETEYTANIINAEYVAGTMGPPSYVFTLETGIGLSADTQIVFGNNVDIPEILESSELTFNSNQGAKCKVEVISRSELLRARGFKVNGE